MAAQPATPDAAPQLPYVVLALDKASRKVVPRFGNVLAKDKQWLLARNEPKFPDQFSIQKTRSTSSMVVIYKMHGCLHADLVDKQDSVVITDSDYVDFIYNR
jgi:hypothetical protein